MTDTESTPSPVGASGSEVLVQSALAGDPQAVSALLERHLPGLRAYVRLRCGAAMRAKESASDIVQSTCRDVLENLGRFRYRGESGFRAWLYATAMRKIADRAEYWGAAKREMRREVPLMMGNASDAGVLDVYSSVCSPSQVAIGHEAAARLETAFDTLSEEDREVIILSRVVGLTHTELAEQLGISQGASRMRLFRALAALSETLGEG